MHDVHTRMTSLHHLLTGIMGQADWACEYPPRHLWGDTGRLERMPRMPRRSFSVRLLRWGGSDR